jgi:hypothetical protein
MPSAGDDGSRKWCVQETKPHRVIVAKTCADRFYLGAGKGADCPGYPQTRHVAVLFLPTLPFYYKFTFLSPRDASLD